MTINREEYRRAKRKLKNKKDYNQTDLLLLEQMRRPSLNDGDLVKIKYNNFKDRSKGEKFQEWISEHKNEIFTVEFEEKYAKNKILCCLKEDTTEPKWLFDTNDLTIVKRIDIKKKEIKEKE